MTARGVVFDLRAAWTGVRRGGFASVAAIAVLAIGIAGALTAGAVAYSGLMRPLPFPRADELVTLRKVYAPTAIESGTRLSQFDEWSSKLAGTARLAAYASETSTVRDAGVPREISAAYVAGPFFEVFGVNAQYGRAFREHDDLDVAVVSHRYAMSLAGSPGGALDRTITVADRPLRIVGVMPGVFSVVGDTDLWMPARGVQSLRLLGADDSRDYTMVARLLPGRWITEFAANAQAVVQQLAPEAQRPNWRARVATARDELLGNSRPVLLAFAGASCLLLAIACANVSLMLINLAVARRREFAVRMALGASRTRLLRAMVLETTFLVTAGGTLGWWLATTAISVLDSHTGLNLPRLATTMDNTPLGAGVIAVCILLVIICSAAPVLSLQDSRLSSPLRSGTSTSAPATRRFRGALVVAQLAIAIVLLVGAGLLGKTLWVLWHTNIGLDASRSVVAMAVPIGQSLSGREAASRAALTDRILADVRRLPGIEAAGIGSNLPPSASQILFTVRFTTSTGDRDVTQKFDLVSATDGYLDALGARIMQGRLFTAADAANNLAVTVISESALQHLGLEGNIIGRELNMSLPSASGPRVRPRIIGVIRDIRYTGLDAPANGAFYVQWRQIPTVRAHLVVRTRENSRALAAGLLPIIRATDPSMPLSEPQMFDDVIDRSLAPRTARFGLVGIYAAGAVLLALVGLSGALMRSVVEQQRDLAVRAALGASPDRLIVMVLRQALGLGLAGSLAGVIASVAAARAASTLVFGVSPYDVSTYAVALTSVLAVVLVACYVPARRAASADPILLLRSE